MPNHIDKPLPVIPCRSDVPNRDAAIPSLACRQSIPRPTSPSLADYPHRHDSRPADKPSLLPPAHGRLTDPCHATPGRRLMSRHARPLLTRHASLRPCRPRPTRPAATIHSVPSRAVPTYLAVLAPRRADSPNQAETCRHATPRRLAPSRHAKPTQASPCRQPQPCPGQPRQHDEPSLTTWQPDPTRLPGPVTDLADGPSRDQPCHDDIPIPSDPHRRAFRRPCQTWPTTRSLAHPWTAHSRPRRHAFPVLS